MDSKLLTDYEYNLVLHFINERLENPYLYSRMWIEGYRSIFNPDLYAPMQIVKFYVLSGREIIEYKYICDTQVTSFSDFKNRITREGGEGDVKYGCNRLIGPWVPADSQIKELVSIIKIYEDIQRAKHDGIPRVISNKNEVSSLI